ncbi:MAG: 50S ribosomal protein L21 [Pacificimonas sp.]
MFAIVRTGGKQYRVAADQIITVDKLDGDVGDKVALDDVLMMADGGDLKDASKEVVHAEVLEQAKAKKIKVFKKKRRHGYRRTQGHRQQLTVLKITALGGKAPAKKTAPKTEAAPEKEEAKAAPAKTAAAPKKAEDKADASKKAAPKKVAPKKAPAKKAAPDKAAAEKPAAEKKAPAKKAATKKAAPKADKK